MSQKFLITGGAGFLGLHLIESIVKNGDKAAVLDIAEIPEPDIRNSVEFIKGDVRNPISVRSALEGVDAVIHSAAALPSWKKKDVYAVNVDGTRVLMEEVTRKGIRDVIFVSTSSVYGIPRGKPFTEDDAPGPISHYGHSKVEAEKICQEYAGRGVRVSIVRPPPIIGKGRLGVFQILFDWVQSGRKIPMIGNGANRYQLVSAEDLVSACLFLIRNKDVRASGIFNVGADSFGTIREDLAELCAHAGSGARPFGFPSFPVKTALRIFEILHLSPIHKGIYETADKDYWTRIDKIKSLGWSPEKSNSATLIETYDWYIQNFEQMNKKSGLGHRSPWDQKILSLLKRIM